MGPAHDNKLSPAIESWGVCASPRRAAGRWMAGESPLSPAGGALSVPGAALQRKGKQCGFAVGGGDCAIRTSFGPCYWLLPWPQSRLSPSSQWGSREQCSFSHVKNPSKRSKSFNSSAPPWKEILLPRAINWCFKKILFTWEGERARARAHKWGEGQGEREV